MQFAGPGGGSGGARARGGGFFFEPLKKVCLSNRNIGQICLNVYFLFYSFVYYSSPCRKDQFAVLLFFLYGLLVPYFFPKNFKKSFQEEIFLSPCTSKNVPPFQKSN